MKKIVLSLSFLLLFAVSTFAQTRTLHPIKWMIENDVYYIGDVKMKAGIDTAFFTRMMHFAVEDTLLTKSEIMQLARDINKQFTIQRTGFPDGPVYDDEFLEFEPEFTNEGLKILTDRGWRTRKIELFEDFLDIVYWK